MDLASSGAADMALSFPVPAGCNTATAATGTAAYMVLNSAGCTGSGCHNAGQTPVFASQTTFMSATIGKASTAGMNYVVAGDPDHSYLLYKLGGLAAKVPGGGGAQMPQGKTPLTAAQLCTIYQWIKNGAPTN